MELQKLNKIKIFIKTNNNTNAKKFKKYFFIQTKYFLNLKKNTIKTKLLNVYLSYIIKLVLNLFSKGKKQLMTKLIQTKLNILLKKKKVKLNNVIFNLIKYLNIGLKFTKYYKSGKKYLIPTVLLYNQKHFYFFFKGYFQNLKKKTYKNNLNDILSKILFSDLLFFNKTKNSLKSNNIFKSLKLKYIKNLRNSHLYLRLKKK